MEAFQGSSGGWVTEHLRPAALQGPPVHLAFVFGSDRTPTGGEGWYIDQVKVETRDEGAPICQVTEWPGSVPATVAFELVAPDTIEASWDAVVQRGDGCRARPTRSRPAISTCCSAGGSYSHAPVDDLCDRRSPATFTPGAGNEYYLVLPNLDGREGGAGADSYGAARPLSAAACGLYREAVCP